MGHRTVVFVVGLLTIASTAVAGIGHVVFGTEEVQLIVRKQAQHIELSLPMPTGVELALKLERMSVVDPTSRLTVMTDTGPVHSLLASRSATYRAKLADGGFAVFTFDESGAVLGMISDQSGRYSISRSKSNSNPTDYEIVREEMRPFTCGTSGESISEDLKRLVIETQLSAKENREKNQSIDTIDMKLAVEVDFKLRTKLLSVNLATIYVNELVALLSTIYESELAIRFVLGNVRIWDNAADPYPDDMGIFAGLLDRFINEYRTKMTSVDRDLALLLVSRSGAGGIAGSIGGLCLDRSYCAGDVLADLEGGLSTYVLDIFMMAHEIGHVCGGLHTQSCIWSGGPLDSCVASEDGMCVTMNMTRPSRGTIMSYCHQQLYNGGTLVYEFHPLSRNVLRAYTRSAPCLTNNPPVITNRVEGVVTNGITGAPVSGMRLTIGRYYDANVPLVANIGMDTVTTTAADGSYSFNDIGSGLFFISPENGWVPYPINVSGLRFPFNLSVADSVTRFDLNIAPGRQVEIVVASRNTNTTHVVHVYSEKFPNLKVAVSSKGPLDRINDSTLSFTAFAPVGTYSIVPTAANTLYTPSKIVVDVADGSTSDTISFVAANSISNLTSLALGIAQRPASPTTVRPHFIGGMGYQLYNNEQKRIVRSGVVPDDGVLVIDSIATGFTYRTDIALDSALFAPCSGDPNIYPKYGTFANMFVVQERRRPVIARPYTMSIRHATYMPLTSPTIVYDSTITSDAPSLINTPFPLRIGDREFSTLYLSHFGYVTFGDIPPDPYMENPFYFGVETPFSVAALGAWVDYTLVDKGTDRHVAWALEGAEPNRAIAFEWVNGRIYTYDVDDNEVFVGPLSFQLRIYESGAIDMVYDVPDSVQFPFDAWIGLRGNDVLDNNVVTSVDGLNSGVASFQYPDLPRVRIDSREDIPSGVTYHWELATTSVTHDDTQSAIAVQQDATGSSSIISGMQERSPAMIIDMLGEVVQNATLEPGIRTWNISSLASGRYTLLVTSNGVSTAASFMITR